MGFTVGVIIPRNPCRMVVSILTAVITLCAGPALAGGIKTLDGIEKNLFSREVISRCRSFSAAAAELEEHLDEFSHILNLNDKSQLRAAIRDIERLAVLQRELQVRARALNQYLTENRKRLKAEGLEYLIPLRDLTGNSFEQFNSALADYIATRQELLTWTDAHYREIVNGKEEAMAKFSSLSQENERVMEKEYDRYLDRIAYVNDFMKDHPELVSFIDAKKAS